MRKVKYNDWIPVIINKSTNRPVEQSGKWQTQFPNNGYFHCWGIEEGNTVAIIECEDGLVMTLLPDKIMFVNTNESFGTGDEAISKSDFKPMRYLNGIDGGVY